MSKQAPIGFRKPHRSVFFSLLIAIFIFSAPAAFADASYVKDEVIVHYKSGTSRSARAATQQLTKTGQPVKTGRQARVLKIKDGSSVSQTINKLENNPNVKSATPNYIAHISEDFIPNDPGKRSTGTWQNTQWNFLKDAGINAPEAWGNLIAAGKAGGSGVTIAVLDTGVAYSNRKPFKKSPDFNTTRFIKGYDFVSHDPYANDENGHGTHVAGTIAQSTNNGVSLTGIAYNANIMPIRALDEYGAGDAATISRAIRFASKKGAKIINLSLEFGTTVTPGEIPDIISAITYAHNHGSLVVAASGNEASAAIAYPAKTRNAMAIGATTEHRCLAEYSNTGRGLAMVAPGGGADADIPNEPNCKPNGQPGRDIYQLTLVGESLTKFGYPSGYEGTSMAAPHVSAVAALVVASGVIGADPSADQLEQHLRDTAVDLGAAGYDKKYGSGLLDAAAATAPPK